MAIADVKRWQWMLIGAALGAALAGARLWFDPGLEASHARTISRSSFEAGLLPRASNPRPALAQIVIHPKDRDGGYWVTAQQTRTLDMHTDLADPRSPVVKAELTAAVKYRAAEPYETGGTTRPTTRRAAGPAAATSRQAQVSRTFPSVFEYLDQMRKDHPEAGISYRYAWWERPAIATSMWALGGIVLIGGLWPWVIAVLGGAASAKKALAPQYDLSRFGHAPAAPAKPPPDDEPKLDDLLEEEHPASEPAPPPPAPAPPAAAKPLESAPLEAPQTQAQESKEYAGDFYPTEAHAPSHKHNDPQ